MVASFGRESKKSSKIPACQAGQLPLLIQIIAWEFKVSVRKMHPGVKKIENNGDGTQAPEPWGLRDETPGRFDLPSPDRCFIILCS
jgi:hypothetical protein